MGWFVANGACKLTYAISAIWVATLVSPRPGLWLQRRAKNARWKGLRNTGCVGHCGAFLWVKMGTFGANGSCD